MALKVGTQVTVVRHLPRGATNKDHACDNFLDVWMPLLAPSWRLMAIRKDRNHCDQTSWLSADGGERAREALLAFVG